MRPFAVLAPLALTLLVGCDRVLPSTTTVSRGAWTLERHRRPVDAVTTKVWCEVRRDGEPFQPFSTKIATCSLGPGPAPAAIAFTQYDNQHDGLYVATTRGGAPLRVSEDPMAEGFWTSDGAFYVTKGARATLATGQVDPIAPWTGWFVDLSPDGTIVLSVQGDAQNATLYLSTADGRPANVVTLPRPDYAWLLDRSPAEEGTLDGPNLGVARRIRWQRDADSNWQILL